MSMMSSRLLRALRPPTKLANISVSPSTIPSTMSLAPRGLSSPLPLSRYIHSTLSSRGAKNIFEEDRPKKKKKDETVPAKTDEDESSEEPDSDDSYDENEPVRKRRAIKMEPYDPEFVATLLKQLKATDVCVIDISEKVDWVKYMVYATGRSKAHIKSMANSLLMELKMRRPGYNWKLDQKSCDFWVIVNSGDILVNLFTEEEREEYDLERVWILRRDEKNPFRADFDEEEETRWIYDDDDDGFMMDDDPDVAKIIGWKGEKK